MPRYIDAENIPTKFINFGMPTVICGIEVPDIDSAPTLSPDEVRGVGEWEHQELAPTNWTFCSVCGRHRSKKYKWYYCPNCGARMEVSEDA